MKAFWRDSEEKLVFVFFPFFFFFCFVLETWERPVWLWPLTLLSIGSLWLVVQTSLTSERLVHQTLGFPLGQAFLDRELMTSFAGSLWMHSTVTLWSTGLYRFAAPSMRSETQQRLVVRLVSHSWSSCLNLLEESFTWEWWHANVGLLVSMLSGKEQKWFELCHAHSIPNSL